MRKLLPGGLLSVLGATSLLAATTPLYINNSPLLSPPSLPPQIDATAFLNRSVFDVSSFFGGFIFIVGDQAFSFGGNRTPYQMMNTRFVTNAPGAIMRGSPGFQFDYFSATNNARLALDTWENRGTVAGNPLVRVMATNIFHRGALEVSDLGLIKLQGTNVDLRRSTLLAGRGANTPPSGGGGTFGTNHSNASGVTDLDWGAGINNRVTNGGPAMRLDVPGFTNLAAIASPPAQYIQLGFAGFITNFWVNFGAGSHPFVYTNQLGPDEFQVQVAFVPTNFSFFPGVSDFTTDVRFLPGNANGGADVMIAMEARDFDIISGDFITNGLYFIDHSAFTTNITMTWNGTQGARRTRRPSTYELFRVKPFAWDLGVPANGTFTETTLYNPNMTTNFVTNAYAHYGARFESAAFTNINIFGVPVVPPPGRVEIFGDNVNLDNARIRAETTLTVKAQNLSSNSIAIVDAPLIEYDLGSTSPPLVIENLATDSVRRLSGVIDMWSGVWDTTETDPADTNRVITTHFHVLIFEFFQVQTDVPVVIRDFFLKADEINIVDSITVGRALRLDARDLTITGELFVQPTGYNLASSNVLNLINFTNLGIVDTFGLVSLGVGDGVSPLDTYVSGPGSVFLAAGHAIGAADLQIAGAVQATAGGISIFAESVNLSGNLGATSDIDILADTLSASNSFIIAGAPGAPASLILDVSSSLTDGGTGEPNDWTAHGGIQALTLPSVGDLLGTTVRVPLLNFGEALILWPAADFGPSAAGFNNNNLPLGTLVLDGGTFSLFRFEGVQDPGAIYINRLELFGEPAADPVGAIEIEVGMTVYFADSNVDPTTLDGLHNGRLRWVPGFAGPLNSTNVVYPSGESYTLNAALVRSMVLDSDGDGIVNGLDATPVIVGDRIDLQIATSRGEPKKTVISWMAPANSTSVVEFRNSLTAGTWQPLPSVENGAIAQRLSISDAPPGTAVSQRFYRVRTQQR